MKSYDRLFSTVIHENLLLLLLSKLLEKIGYTEDDQYMKINKFYNLHNQKCSLLSYIKIINY